MVTKTKPKSLSIISLFSGSGGMDIGFEKAGFNTVFANEYDKNIAPSFQQYFPNTKFDGRSILDIPNTNLPTNVVGIIGGPPCQSWSEAGAKRGINDPRGQLFFEYERVISHVKPLFFVAENVSGILHARNKPSFDNILQRFTALGYTVTYKLVNASDYGVPQDRERVIIVGYKDKLKKSFTFPGKLSTKVTLRDSIGDLEFANDPEVTTAGFSSMFMSRNRVRGWDEQSFTILATDRHIPFHPQAPKMVKVSGDLWKFFPGSESLYRRLTLRECARIQTFPDNYKFIYKHIRDGYKMVGNAVPVELAYHVANAIRVDLGI